MGSRGTVTEVSATHPSLPNFAPHFSFICSLYLTCGLSFCSSSEETGLVAQYWSPRSPVQEWGKEREVLF